MLSRYHEARFAIFDGILFLSILLFIILLGSLPVSANPAGGQVVAGQATIQQHPGTLTVNQASDRAVINWQGFSINSNELTRFVQPSNKSAVLNRVTGSLSSELHGTLEANGQVFLINPNGVLVGPTGRIDTAAFAATTLNLPDSSFMAGGDLLFSGDSTAAILNLGTISASDGDVLLVARQIENSGTLSAPEGTAALAAGSEVLMTMAGDERLVIETGLILTETEQIGVDNSGLIKAGRAELKAAHGNMYALAVNNSGVINATGLVNEGGRVMLKSLGGTIDNSGSLTACNIDHSGGDITIAAQGEDPSAVVNSGTLDVSGTTTNALGGTVTVTAETISLSDGTHIDASGDAGGGQVHIGGGFQGSNPEIFNAQKTLVDHDVTISADAVTKGNGGEVIVWSDEKTGFAGTITARGGVVSGDGGFVEVSGKESLMYNGLTDTRAPSGTWGTLLLDPSTIEISDGFETDDTGNNTTDYWRPATISGNLAGGNVHLLADDFLLFESGIISWATPSTLTLEAPNLVDMWGSSSIYGYNAEGSLAIRSGNLQQYAGSTIDVGTLHLYQAIVNEGSVSLLGTISASDLILETADLTGLNNYGNTFSEITINNSSNAIGAVTFLREDPHPSVEAPSWAKFSNVHIYTQGDLTIDCQQDSEQADLSQRFATPVVMQAERDIIISAGTRLAMDTGQSGLALVAGRNFINKSDENALTATDGNSRFNIYSTDPRDDTWGGLTGYKHYNTTFNPAQPALGQMAAFGYTLAPTLTLTVNDTDMTYGGSYPDFTVDFDGLIAGDTRNNSSSFTHDTAATETSPVGDYLVGIGGINGPLLSNAEGYTLVYVPGTLTIDPAPLTIRPQDYTRTYGAENPANFSVNYTGFVLEEDESVVTGLSVGTAASQQSDAGEYAIVATGAQTANYAITTEDGTLTVEPAELIIKANDATRRIGDPDPAYTISCSGLMAWDQDAQGNCNEGVIENLWFDVEGSPGSDALPGIYPIMVSATSLNYNITNCSYDDLGALIIKEPYQLLISADDRYRLYGEANPVLSVSFDGFEDGDDASVVTGLALDTTAEERSDTGTYPITILDSGYSLPPYYTVILREGSLTVNPAPLNITALDASVTYGSSLPTFTATVTGLLPGDSLDTPYDFSVPAGRLDAGTHAIGITGGSAENYEIFRHKGTLTVDPAALVISADDKQMIQGQPYPLFTATATGLMYDDTIDVLSGLNLVAVDEIQMGGSGMVVTTVPPAENMMFINQSGNLTAQNYAPITFKTGLLTINEPQLVINTITIETETTTDSSGTGGRFNPYDLIRPLPFGVPADGQGFIQYAAKLFIRKAGLDVPDIDEWLQDPASRALVLGQMLDLLKAPIKEGTALYNQREVFKTHLEDQIREMKVAIAKDAVERYNAWKAEQQEDSNRFLGLLGGNLETPDEDFTQLATMDYIGKRLLGILDGSLEMPDGDFTDDEMVAYIGTAANAVALTAMFDVVGSMMATSSVITLGGVAKHGVSAVVNGIVQTVDVSGSLSSTIATPISVAVFALVTTVTRAIQVAAYDKVEDKYANLVSDAQNFDIDTLINGDDADLGQLYDFMFIAAAQ